MGSYVTFPSLCLPRELPEISAASFAAHSAGSRESKEITTGCTVLSPGSGQLWTWDTGCPAQGRRTGDHRQQLFPHLQSTLGQRGPREPHRGVYEPLPTASAPNRHPVPPPEYCPCVFLSRPDLSLSATWPLSQTLGTTGQAPAFSLTPHVGQILCGLFPLAPDLASSVPATRFRASGSPPALASPQHLSAWALPHLSSSGAHFPICNWLQ